MDCSVYHGKKAKRGLGIWIMLALGAVAAVLGVFALHNNNKPGEIEAAYIDFINGLDCPEGYTDYPYLNNLRFGFGYVDSDNIPELLLCYGTGHVDPVQVYSYDPQDNGVDLWGEFSSFGTFSYYERQGITISQYGGTGFWYHVYERINYSGADKVLAVSGINAIRDPIRYYWQSPCEVSSGEDLWYDFDFDKIEVSEEEKNESARVFHANYTNEIEVDYDDMTEFSPETFCAVFQTLKDTVGEEP